MKPKRNIYAASLRDGKFQPKIVAVKKRKLIIKELKKEMDIRN